MKKIALFMLATALSASYGQLAPDGTNSAATNLPSVPLVPKTHTNAPARLKPVAAPNREANSELAAIRQQIDEVQARLVPLEKQRQNYWELARAKGLDHQSGAVEQAAIRNLDISIIPLQKRLTELQNRYRVRAAQFKVQEAQSKL